MSGRTRASRPKGAERDLIDRHAAEIDVDVLQVGHHGSMTSSRSGFLAAVSPSWALVAAGPFPYGGGVVLPDPEVLPALEDAGATILQTDLHDGGCPVADRIGRGNHRPGGCDNFVLELPE